MKYGETLRQRSIPAWSHYNIDYDDIKLAIKEHTTPGKGKTISVPGRPDEKLKEFENDLFAVLASQHDRIDLFVKSKAGEIQRRIDHAKRQLRQLDARATAAADQRIPINRLERFGRLENDVLKAGDDIKSLARFTSTQRTAFRKLLKKYKKWTGSGELEDRFRQDVLDDSNGFTHVDLGPLLDDYSATLQQIRALYEERTQVSGRRPPRAAEPQAGSSVIAQLQSAVDGASKVEFDTAMATVPLGERGTFASYFVHPENVVELQVLLLQHSQYYTPRSRSNSINSPISSSPTDSKSDRTAPGPSADFFAVEADDVERFARDLNSLTIDEREHRAGATPQKAKVCVRWNPDEDAYVSFRADGRQTHYAGLKKRQVGPLLDRQSPFSPKKAASSAAADSERAVAAIRDAIEQDVTLRPLYAFSSARSRFVGTGNSDQHVILATLDTGLSIQKAAPSGSTGEAYSFPFALLLVRQEGSPMGLVPALDQSHLVERVRGFSLEYHAIWQTQRTATMPPPFWLPILDRDIRKLPPPAARRSSSSAIQTPASVGSPNGDSTTAVETGGPSDSVVHPSDELGAPAIRSFRKKRRRSYRPPPPQPQPEQPQQRYWSEYDHPEDGSDDGDAYVIYVDPNAKSSFDVFFDRLGSLFRRRGSEKDALLSEATTSRDDESSSEEEDTALATKAGPTSYGTFASADHETQWRPPRDAVFMPHTVAICFAAALVILAVAYLLAATGKHKLAYEVYAGVLFAIASSLAFAIIGFASLLRSDDIPRLAWLLGTAVLIVDVIGSGGLLAWILG